MGQNCVKVGKVEPHLLLNFFKESSYMKVKVLL